MNKKVLSLALLVALLASAFSVIPVFAWSGPPYVNHYPTEDTQFEMFGPRADNILIKMYAGTDPMWEALRAGDIDITDWSLTRTYLDDFLSCDEPHVAIADAGGELGMWCFDMNNDPWRNDDGDGVVGDEGDTRNPFGDPTLIEIPSGHPYLAAGEIVTRGSQLRLAVAHLLSRADIIALTGARHIPIWVHCPENDIFRLADFINDDVMKYPYNPALAAGIMTMAGYVDTNANTWRNYDSDGDGDIDADDADINLAFYTRLDAFRATLGDWMETNLINPPIKIQVTRYPVTGGGAWQAYMLEKRGNCYTAGWIVSREPTLPYFLYHSDFYWHPGDPPNYNHCSDPEFDAASELLAYPPDIPSARVAAKEAQRLMNEPDKVLNIPVACSWMIKAYKTMYSEGTATGPFWQGVINSPGYAINTEPGMPLGSFLNMHPEGTASGGFIIKYGWKENTMPSSLNPYQYSWYWDAETLFRSYEALLVVNPYDAFGGGPGLYPPGDLPWIAFAWEIGETPEGNSKFTFYLRDDIYFHDGTKMTAKDIYYTVQLGHWMALDHPGLTPPWEALPPWFWGNIMDLTPEFDENGVVTDEMGVGVDMPDGPDGYTVVFNYNINSLWAFWWCGVGIPITPKHKWFDVFVPDLRGSDGFCPDPQMIGTGPWKVYPGHIRGDGTPGDHYVPGSSIVLDKNPGFHDKYFTPSPTLELVFTPLSPQNTMDIKIRNHGTTFKRLTVKVVVIGNGNARAWTISGIPVTPLTLGVAGWGTTTPPQMTPGIYTYVVWLYDGATLVDKDRSRVLVRPQDIGIVGDLCHGTAFCKRLDPVVGVGGFVDYRDTAFYGARLIGQSVKSGF